MPLRLQYEVTYLTHSTDAASQSSHHVGPGQYQRMSIGHGNAMHLRQP